MATWLEDVITAVKNLGGIAEYSKIYEEVKKIRGSNLPTSWQAIIRREIETASSDSEAYGHKRDIFFPAKGLGRGIWGLREFSTTPVAFDTDLEDLGSDKTGRFKVETYRILRDTKLARELKLLYNNVCQICEEQIQLNGKTYSEAHHIKPLGKPYNGPDKLDNIIVVCPNCHVKLDYGAIKIEDLRISKHKISNEYVNFHNTTLFGKM